MDNAREDEHAPQTGTAALNDANDCHDPSMRSDNMQYTDGKQAIESAQANAVTSSGLDTTNAKAAPGTPGFIPTGQMMHILNSKIGRESSLRGQCEQLRSKANRIQTLFTFVQTIEQSNGKAHKDDENPEKALRWIVWHMTKAADDNLAGLEAELKAPESSTNDIVSDVNTSLRNIMADMEERKCHA
ncbi:hypothetical protein AC578_4679 [Pseudocercospora eumusae]|uniref:Uncharacterized protein n=1 Tax=Pseudocercospora eumusae TaxID=321146 RepID=A0A139H796_9PEZI|nr:hypothetical protein AC578_4679 [Pseudocercospora eumusae]